MKYSVNPKQIQLFDPDISNYSAVALRRLREDWPGIFRDGILELMPVDMIEDRFHENMGRPTKELFSMCGLIFIMEFRDWTIEEAADAYMFDGRVRYALNLGPDRLSMTTRTIERYRAIFREEECASAVMDRVTRQLIAVLGISVERQRLDSTHVFSNMAIFGRTRLLVTVTKRFLIQLKRHEAELYSQLPAELLDRYQKKSWEFASGRQSSVSCQQAAEDVSFLLGRFEQYPKVCSRNTYKDLLRAFTEQCEVVEGKILVREKPGCDVMQNPSDPHATYDGYKGPGYQVQVSETCCEENVTQLIVTAIPQTACEHDQNAVEKVLDKLEEAGNKPTRLLADTGYGSDQNHSKCADRGVILVSPINNGQHKDHFRLEDFVLAEDNKIVSCPAGQVPVSAEYHAGKQCGSASFWAVTCEACEHFKRCPVQKNRKRYRIQYKAKNLRVMQRRLAAETPEWKKEYALRSGVEATFSRAKSVTGLGKLRVRGEPSVSMAIYLKLAGVNILKAVGAICLNKRLAERLENAFTGLAPHFRLLVFVFEPLEVRLAA